MPILRAYLRSIEFFVARQLSIRARVLLSLRPSQPLNNSVPEPQCEDGANSDQTWDVCVRLGGALL